MTADLLLRGCYSRGLKIRAPHQGKLIQAFLALYGSEGIGAERVRIVGAVIADRGATDVITQLLRSLCLVIRGAARPWSIILISDVLQNQSLGALFGGLLLLLLVLFAFWARLPGLILGFQIGSYVCGSLPGGFVVTGPLGEEKVAAAVLDHFVFVVKEANYLPLLAVGVVVVVAWFRGGGRGFGFRRSAGLGLL